MELPDLRLHSSQDDRVVRPVNCLDVCKIRVKSSSVEIFEMIGKDAKIKSIGTEPRGKVSERVTTIVRICGMDVN